MFGYAIFGLVPFFGEVAVDGYRNVIYVLRRLHINCFWLKIALKAIVRGGT